MEETPTIVKIWLLFCIFLQLATVLLSSPIQLSVGAVSQLLGQSICLILQKIFRSACDPANFLNLKQP